MISSINNVNTVSWQARVPSKTGNAPRGKLTPPVLKALNQSQLKGAVAPRKVTKVARRAKVAVVTPLPRPQGTANTEAGSKWFGKRAWALGGFAVATAVAAAAIFNEYTNISNLFELAAKAMDEGDYKSAQRQYLYLSKVGFPDAQYELGMLYKNGAGKVVTKQPEKAANLFKHATKWNHHLAQYELATMYENGIGVSQSCQKAADLYFSAAAKNHADAKYRMARLHEEGCGVEKNVEKTIQFLQSAAEQNHASALYSLGQHYACGRGVEKDGALAAALMAQANLVDTDDIMEINLPNWTWSKNCAL